MMLGWKKTVGLAAGVLAIGIGCFLWLHDSLGIWRRPQEEPIRGIADNICGPRCVHFILRYYGRGAELQELVREVQWPELDKGATLDSLGQALMRRGIYTCALKIGSSGRLNWRYPAIIHLRGGKAALGHYLVLLPGARTGETDKYVEFMGVSHYPPRAVRERMSGIVMLTSPEPIDDWQTAIVEEKSSLSPIRLTLLVLSSLCVLALMRFGPRLRGCTRGLWFLFRRRQT